MASRRVIAHFDADAFYASVEVLRDPSLRGKPVIVAGSSPRAIVTTASYEARRFGVHSAMPAAHAYRLCPQAVVVRPDFAAYRAASQSIWKIVRERLGCDLQHISLDEAYADITHLQRPLAVLRETVAAVREQTGLSLSVGVGPNKLVAKVCSDAEKPRGFVVCSREDAAARFASQPTRLLQGVGPKTQQRLADMGVHTVADLQRCDLSRLEVVFGARTGRWLRQRAFFEDDAPVQTERIVKSRSNERTFDVDVDDIEALGEALDELAAELATQLQDEDKQGKTITIKVRCDDWTTVTRARTLEHFTNDPVVIRRVARALLAANEPQRPVRLVGVRVSSFADVIARQQRERAAQRPAPEPPPVRIEPQLRIPGLAA